MVLIGSRLVWQDLDSYGRLLIVVDGFVWLKGTCNVKMNWAYFEDFFKGNLDLKSKY